jgi:hypothetical protein
VTVDDAASASLLGRYQQGGIVRKNIIGTKLFNHAPPRYPHPDLVEGNETIYFPVIYTAPFKVWHMYFEMHVGAELEYIG